MVDCLFDWLTDLVIGRLIGLLVDWHDTTDHGLYPPPQRGRDSLLHLQGSHVVLDK